MQIKAFILNHEIGEDEIVAMNVPKFNETQFNTGIAMIHFKSEESVARALELKGTHIGERCDGSVRKRGVIVIVPVVVIVSVAHVVVDDVVVLVVVVVVVSL